MAETHVTPEDYSLLREACDALDATGIPYVIGGGTAVVEHGRNRRTKDFDIFLNREVLEPAMRALVHASFTTSDTEKRWLYKAWRGETLVDLIVEVRGGIRIDDEVMRRAVIVEQYGHPFRLMGAEDTLYRKALTLTEGRPDWHDGISIIDRQRGQLDWNYLMRLSAQHPRRMLSFLLFAQTELHVPHNKPATITTDNLLYSGEAPGPIPDWVVFTLVRRVWMQEAIMPETCCQLEFFPKAA